MSDGTTINAGSGGDLISDEDLTGRPRRSPDVPPVGSANGSYKIERTKIAIGSYGQDMGDVSSDGGRGLPVELSTERRLLELATIAQMQAAMQQLAVTRGRDVVSMFGRTGRDGRF